MYVGVGSKLMEAQLLWQTDEEQDFLQDGEVKIGQQDAPADANYKWVRIILAPELYRPRFTGDYHSLFSHDGTISTIMYFRVLQCFRINVHDLRPSLLFYPPFTRIPFWLPSPRRMPRLLP